MYTQKEIDHLTKICVDVANSIPHDDVVGYCANNVSPLKPIDGRQGGAIFNVDTFNHKGYVMICLMNDGTYEVHFGKITPERRRIRIADHSVTGIKHLNDVAKELTWMSKGIEEFVDKHGWIPHGQKENPMTFAQKVDAIISGKDTL